MKTPNFWQRVQAFIGKPEGDLQAWREYLLNIVLIIFLLLGSLAYVSSMRRALAQGVANFGVSIFTLAYLLLFVVALVRRIPFKVRAGVLIVMVYAVGIAVFFVAGLMGSGRIWIFTFSAITVLFFGLRAGIASIVLNMGTLAFFIWQVSRGQLLFEQQPISDWINTTVTFLMLNTVVTLSQGALIRAFEANLAQARAVATTLEQRVADRTRDLEASIAVSSRLSTILNPRELVTEVVSQIQKAFNYYHVHIYLLDESGQNLIMAGGTGEAGETMLARGHKIPYGKGLVGRAATANDVVLASDVALEQGWLPNPLLPETKAEIAVPIRLADRVLGVLDVQQNSVGGLTEDDARLLQSVANQVAVALRNARLFEQTQEMADREATLNLIGQRIQTATDVESVLQIAARELGRALAAQRANVQLHNPGSPMRAAQPNGGSAPFSEKLT